MAETEKARVNGPIPKCVLADAAEFKANPINLQVSALTRRCAISVAMAEALAPLAFGSAA